MKGLYTENCKKLKEIEKDTKKWKDIPCSWISRINIVKTSKVIYRFRAIAIKIPMIFFTEIAKTILKYLYGAIKDPE